MKNGREMKVTVTEKIGRQQAYELPIKDAARRIATYLDADVVAVERRLRRGHTFETEVFIYDPDPIF